MSGVDRQDPIRATYRRVPHVLLTLAAALLAACLPSRPVRGAAPEVWFEDVLLPVGMKDEDAEALVRAAAARILGGAGAATPFPRALEEDELPRIVLVSVSDGLGPARVALGTGNGIVPAVQDAVRRAADWRDLRPRWIKVDVVQRCLGVARGALLRGLTLERSLHGLAFNRSAGVAFLPGELVARTLVNSDGRIMLANIQEVLDGDATRRADVAEVLRRGDFGIFRFSADSFFCDGKEFCRLYRGHRVPKDVNRADLLAAAVSGGNYLVRSVGADGRFVYSYLPKQDIVKDSYNILRHAGATYAMLELYEVTRDDGVLEAARRALGYLLDQVRPYPGQLDAACVVEDGYVKLGGNGLAAIALSKYAAVTGDRSHVQVMHKLVAYIQLHQTNSGRFVRQKESYPGGADTHFSSMYYPGEAILALVRAHAVDPRESYLDAAEKGARFLIEVRDGGLPVRALPADHWLLYALNELYRQRPNGLYLEHSINIATSIAMAQNPEPDYPDWRGTYGEPPRTAPAATRAEGLLAAHALARDYGRPQEADVFLQAAGRSASFLLQTQFRPESAMYLKDPQRCLGGFRRSLTDYEIRIDYVQHSISSLLLMREALRARKAGR